MKCFHSHSLASITAAAAAKSLQSCPTLCNPIDGSPPGSPVPGILQARTLEWVAISFSNAWKWKVKVKSLSRVRLSDPMDCRLPGASIHGIFQAEVLEWVATAFSSLAHYCLLIPSVHCLYLHNVQHSLVRLYIVSFKTHTHTHIFVLRWEVRIHFVFCWSIFLVVLDLCCCVGFL